MKKVVGAGIEGNGSRSVAAWPLGREGVPGKMRPVPDRSLREVEVEVVDFVPYRRLHLRVLGQIFEEGRRAGLLGAENHQLRQHSPAGTGPARQQDQLVPQASPRPFRL